MGNYIRGMNGEFERGLRKYAPKPPPHNFPLDIWNDFSQQGSLSRAAHFALDHLHDPAFPNNDAVLDQAAQLFGEAPADIKIFAQGVQTYIQKMGQTR